MLRRATLVCVLALTVTSVNAQPPARSADFLFHITTRVRENGKFETTLKTFELRCISGECQLAILTLNDCVEGISMPDLDLVSTRQELIVQDLGNALQVQWPLSNGSLSLRFGYRRSSDRITGTELISFSGARVRHSSGKVNTTEFVPFPKGLHTVKMDCAFTILGLPR